MEYASWYTGIVILLMSFGLAREYLRPHITVFSALLLLVFGRIISVEEAFRGFSNQGMLTVGFLFIVSAGLQSSGFLDTVTAKLLGNKNSRFKYFRIMFPVAGLSAFLNNTPIVAALIPIIRNWCRKTGLPASKFLIPLSYAAIFGGTCTLIGTSTNLVVHGMLMERGLGGLGFFEITKVGLPVTILGIAAIALIGHRLLPGNKEPMVELGEHTREFVVEMKVAPRCPMIGKTVEKAHLRHLQGLFLFEISRDDTIIAPVKPEEKIKEGDRLFFTGLPETIYELQKTPGLVAVKDVAFDMQNIDSDKLGTYEAVISDNSPLIGKNVRECNFRGRYNGVILAIHRSGHRINKKVGDIIFKTGDTLFILAEKGFDKKWYHSKDFLLVTSSIEIYSKPRWKGNLSVLLLFAMVILAACKVIPMVLAAAAAAVLMVLTGITSSEKAMHSVNWSVLLIIASSFGIGKALENSGLAFFIAATVIKPLYILGPIGVITGIFLITNIYTELITNNAAVAIMFPVALAAVDSLGLDCRPLIITLTIAASASFATPIGYQTNLMVYGPGGYRFFDFFKAGICMNIFVWLATTGLVFFYFF